MVPMAELKTRVKGKQVLFPNKCWVMHLLCLAGGLHTKKTSLFCPVWGPRVWGRPPYSRPCLLLPGTGNLSPQRSTECTSRAHVPSLKGPCCALLSRPDVSCPSKQGATCSVSCLAWVSHPRGHVGKAGIAGIPKQRRTAAPGHRTFYFHSSVFVHSR